LGMLFKLKKNPEIACMRLLTFREKFTLEELHQLRVNLLI